MSVCVCACVRACVSVCVRVCTGVSVCVRECVRVRVRACVHFCLCVRVCACTRARARVWRRAACVCGAPAPARSRSLARSLARDATRARPTHGIIRLNIGIIYQRETLTRFDAENPSAVYKPYIVPIKYPHMKYIIYVNFHIYANYDGLNYGANNLRKTKSAVWGFAKPEVGSLIRARGCGRSPSAHARAHVRERERVGGGRERGCAGAPHRRGRRRGRRRERAPARARARERAQRARARIHPHCARASARTRTHSRAHAHTHTHGDAQVARTAPYERECACGSVCAGAGPRVAARGLRKRRQRIWCVRARAFVSMCARTRLHSRQRKTDTLSHTHTHAHTHQQCPSPRASRRAMTCAAHTGGRARRGRRARSRDSSLSRTASPALLMWRRRRCPSPCSSGATGPRCPPRRSPRSRGSSGARARARECL